MEWWWSWLLTSVGVTGLYFAGRNKSWGWGIGIGAQILWMTYATVTHQWGFYISAIAYGWVYTKNFLQWRKGHAVSDRRETEGLEPVDIMYIGCNWGVNYEPHAAIIMPSGKRMTGADFVRIRNNIVEQAVEDQMGRHR